MRDEDQQPGEEFGEFIAGLFCCLIGGALGAAFIYALTGGINPCAP